MAHVADAAYVIQHLELAPCVVVGQSLGGVTALLLAASRPDLVCALVVVEATPIAPDEAVIERVAKWLASWPVPFPNRAAAVEFFGGPSLRAETWADGLQEREDGWRPQFDEDVILRTLREACAKTFWAEWASIRCPTLVVGGEIGSLPPAEAQRMLGLLSHGSFEMVPGAGHDLHLERPDHWRSVVEEFIGSVGGAAGSAGSP